MNARLVALYDHRGTLEAKPGPYERDVVRCIHRAPVRRRQATHRAFVEVIRAKGAALLAAFVLNDPRLNWHSVTYSQDTNLSEILHENMGDVHFAACRYADTGGNRIRNQDEGLFNL